MSIFSHVTEYLKDKMLDLVSEDFLKDLQEQVLKLHKRALKTKNPFDDLFTAMLCKAFRVKIEE